MITAAHVAKDLWNGAESFVVSNKELIAKVGGDGVADFLEQILVNPGDTIFELLSTEAKGFAQYVVEKMDFIYYPEVPTDTTGSVLLAADYDVNDDPDFQFMSSTEVEKHLSTHKGAVTTPSWDEVRMKGDVKSIMSSGTRKIIRAGPVLTADLESYDSLQLYVKGSGLPTTPNLTTGKVWCDYRIRFFEPSLENDRLMTHMTSVYESIRELPWNTETQIAFTALAQLQYNPWRLELGPIGAVNCLKMPQGIFKVNVNLSLECLVDVVDANVQRTGVETYLTLRRMDKYGTTSSQQLQHWKTNWSTGHTGIGIVGYTSLSYTAIVEIHPDDVADGASIGLFMNGIWNSRGFVADVVKVHHSYVHISPA
jgi:hypothetical protein